MAYLSSYCSFIQDSIAERSATFSQKLVFALRNCVEYQGHLAFGIITDETPSSEKISYGFVQQRPMIFVNASRHDCLIVVCRSSLTESLSASRWELTAPFRQFIMKALIISLSSEEMLANAWKRQSFSFPRRSQNLGLRKFEIGVTNPVLTFYRGVRKKDQAKWKSEGSNQSDVLWIKGQGACCFCLNNYILRLHS